MIEALNWNCCNPKRTGSYDYTRAIDVESEPRAHVIKDDGEAIAIAKELALEFQKEDSQRDRERRLPIEEVQKFSQSGLWGIIVPKAYGGAGVSNATLAEVIKIISEADSSLGQIPRIICICRGH